MKFVWYFVFVIKCFYGDGVIFCKVWVNGVIFLRVVCFEYVVFFCSSFLIIVFYLVIRYLGLRNFFWVMGVVC